MWNVNWIVCAKWNLPTKNGIIQKSIERVYYICILVYICCLKRKEKENQCDKFGFVNNPTEEFFNKCGEITHEIFDIIENSNNNALFHNEARRTLLRGTHVNWALHVSHIHRIQMDCATRKQTIYLISAIFHFK